MYGTIKDGLITLPYLKGKIYTLQGRCFLESGLITEAETCFNLAVKTMGYYFPKSRIMIKTKTAIMLKKLKKILTWFRPCKVGILDGIAADYVDQFANCLAQMFIIFRVYISKANLIMFFYFYYIKKSLVNRFGKIKLLFFS